MNENATYKSKMLFSIEKDMLPRPFLKEDHFSSKIFKNYPLVGDYILSDEALEKMHSNAKKYIDRAMLPGEKAKYKNWVYEQVAIVVVNYAKKWNSFEEGKFSRYIAMQFGYKDDSGKVWRIISEALEIAFNSNGRFFIKSSNGDRQFYETVMAHSFGPSGSWEPLLELLFSFYTNNLDWNYVPGDPLFSRFVMALQKHFNNETNTDDKFLIASQYYYLRIGIRRLVLERPGYCVYLFETLVKRIHQRIQNEANDTQKYSYQLVDNWFVNRINQAIPAEGKKKQAQERKENTDLALDYSKISIKYILQNGLPALRIPSIRVMDETSGVPSVTLYMGSEKVAASDLEIYGNELGETIRGKILPLPLTTKGTGDLNYRVVIQRGSSTIYDSENNLSRPLLVFSEGKEISPTKIRREKYLVYAKNINKLIGKNVDIVPFVNGMCEVSFHKNYSLEYWGNTIAIDSSDIQGIRIVKPAISEAAVFEIKGEEYQIAKPSASLKVYYSERKILQKYSLRIDDKQYQLSEFEDTMSGNRAVIPLSSTSSQTMEVSLVDIAAGVIVFHQKYILFSSFKVTFDKEYYALSNQYSEIKATVIINDAEYLLQGQTGNELVLNYKNGRILLAVPSVDYQFTGIEYLYLNKYIRSSELNSSSVLKIANATGMMHTVFVGENAYPGENEIDLSQYASRGILAPQNIPIYLDIAGNKTKLAEILYQDIFVKSPSLLVKDNVLLWDGGETYVGDRNGHIELAMSQSGEELYRFPLLFGVQKIHIFDADAFADGVYHCSFSKNGMALVEFSVFLGDERKARFSDKIIQIDQVTEDLEGNAKAVSVKTVFIDQIKYIDTCYVDTEDDVFDVYTGCMYWINYYGEKKYLSFKYNDQRSKYKVNPVKIIYISNRYLRIVNEDDEGIFYFYNEYSSTPGYEITDIEPSKSAKGYHDILFYLYSTNSTVKVDKISPLKEVTAIVSPIQKASESIQTQLPLESTTESLFKNLIEATQETIIQLPVDTRALVNAGPGTGKTWTLIERIIHLLQNDVDPESIQVLCFSRAAVEVVRSRMDVAIQQGRVDVDANKVDIRTFDSFCTQLLYWVKESDYKEISSNFNIESLSYDDRIRRFTEIVKAQPQLIEQCEHLIVDEVQDLVLSRAEMVLALISLLPSNSGVTLFGDACQAIYDYQVEEGMSSIDFYSAIKGLNQFKFFSFTKNYRQTSKLQDYCSDYRQAILENDLEKCAEQLALIFEDMPDYDVTEIKRFSEDSLDKLKKSGNVGILTRSNAQALMISALFRKKNIAHAIQRRLSEDSLSGWIGIMFNSSPVKYYDEDSFVAMFTMLCPEYQDIVNPIDVWNQLSGTNSSMVGKLSSKTLLVAIKNRGKSKGLYSEVANEAVTISTIHRSKGREYDSVLVLNSLLSENAKEPEEHRVNYVALSRAKNRMYKVDLSNAYFRTLENRRCYSVGTVFKSGSHYLRFFEIGRSDDLIRSSFCALDGVQKAIKSAGRSLIGKEVYLRKDRFYRDGTISYAIVLRETEQVLAFTSKSFSDDLSSAIRQIKNLPRYAPVYENLYPAAFSGIYITDIASEIGMIQGLEKDVVEHEGFVAWNTLLIEGYSKAEY